MFTIILWLVNFFNAIGIADIERVHSSVIGWMLSDGCKALGLDVKSILLCKLFGKEPSRFFSTITVNVEIFNIDILIETEDEPQTKECWIIENKIKSNQHGNQLDKYVQIIAGEKIGKEPKAKLITEKYKEIPEEHRHFCFLTLIDEKPQGGSQQKWLNSTYEKLYGILACALGNGNKKHEHWIILNEYAKCIKEMNDALSDFLNHPTNYSQVFTDGSKRKDEKDAQYLQNIETASGKFGCFISKCGLETIFQKCYLGKRWNEYLENTKKEHKWSISESRGNAALDIHYPMIEDNSTREKYYTQIEFQNGTFKVQITLSKETTFQKNIFLNRWERVFEEIRNELNNGKKTGRWRKNLSKSNNNSRYISLSFKVVNWWEKNLSDVWKMIETCENIREKLIENGNCKEVNS